MRGMQLDDVVILNYCYHTSPDPQLYQPLIDLPTYSETSHTIGESQFVQVSLVERFNILMTIITIIVIRIHVVIIILKNSCNVASLA